MKSIYDVVSSNKKMKDIMTNCYLDLTKGDNTQEFISTNVISINLLLSGIVNGGIPIGKISMISAPSMLGKTYVGMAAIRNAQQKNMQVIIIDAERAFNLDSAISLGIDVSPDKLFIFQDNSIENVKTFILNIFDGMTKEERKNVFVVIDSWSSLVTSKTIDDAISGKDVMDMTDPKKKNVLATVILNTKATWFIINHVYNNIGGFGDKFNIPGGRKIVNYCDCIVMGMSRSKEKDSNDEIDGYIVTAKTYKSRFSKISKKLKFRIKMDGGLDPYYGILEDLIDGGYIVVGKHGNSPAYKRAHIQDDKFVKESNIYNSNFWLPVFVDTDAKEFLRKRYSFEEKSNILNESAELEKITGDD